MGVTGPNTRRAPGVPPARSQGRALSLGRRAR